MFWALDARSRTRAEKNVQCVLLLVSAHAHRRRMRGFSRREGELQRGRRDKPFCQV